MQQVAAQLPWFHNCVLLDKVITTFNLRNQSEIRSTISE